MHSGGEGTGVPVNFCQLGNNDLGKDGGIAFWKCVARLRSTHWDSLRDNSPGIYQGNLEIFSFPRPFSRTLHCDYFSTLHSSRLVRHERHGQPDGSACKFSSLCIGSTTLHFSRLWFQSWFRGRDSSEENVIGFGEDLWKLWLVYLDLKI